MLYSTIDSRPISLALYAGGQWLNWSKSASVPVWESPFSAETHLLACKPDPTFPTFQQAAVPDSAITRADCLVMFADGVPLGCEAVPPNVYFGPYGTGGTLR